MTGSSGGGVGGKVKPGTASSTSKTATNTTSSTSGTSTTNINQSTMPVIPKWGQQLMKGGAQDYGDALDALVSGFQDFQIPPEAMDQLLATARGDYLMGPEAIAAQDAIARRLTPYVTSKFGASGRGDNFLGADTLAQTISDSWLTNLFNPERARMANAASLIPDIAVGSFFNPTLQLGSALQGINPLVSPFIGSKTTGTNTTTTTGNSVVDSIVKGMQKGTETPYYFPGSQVGSIGGGVLAGLGTGAQLGSIIPGIGTGIGAGIGGLAGGLLSAFG